MIGFERFRTTLWTEVLRGREETTALERVLDRYREPICSFLEAQGLQFADAEDVTQEVLRRISERDIIGRVDRGKGRFRCYLMAIARNALGEYRRRARAQRRGGGRAPVPLLPDDVPAQEEEEAFDRVWVASLLGRAVLAASSEDRARGIRHVEVLLEGALGGVPHAEIARRRGIGVQDVKNWTHRARKRIAAHLMRLVRETTSSAEEYAEELRVLARYIGDAQARLGP